MQYLIKNAQIKGEEKYAKGAHHIYIKDGIIQEISKNEIQVEGETKIIDGKNTLVSSGWIDMRVNFCDPGFEHKEDLNSGCDAAASGGFTEVCTLPSTLPVADNKSVIEYLQNKSEKHPVKIYPYGTLSAELKGKEMSEIFDMKSAGAIAFTDDIHAVSNAGLLQRLLLYTKNCNALAIQYPENESLSLHGQMHEGDVSTQFGIKARPDLAEHIQIQRDLSIAKFYDSPIHFANISSEKSVDLIRNAKKEGIKVTCDVCIHNLRFTENNLNDLDINFKLLPPLRSENDRLALINGIEDGTIDSITSNHTPIEDEGKKVEFDYADFGAIGLQTFFNELVEIFGENSENKWLKNITEKPRHILGIKQGKIEVGEIANLTIYNYTDEWTYNLKNNHSKSKNSMYLNQTLKGKITGIINNRKSFWNE